MAEYGDFSLKFSSDFFEQLDEKELEEIIAAIETDGEGFYDITMDVTKNDTEHQLISSKNSLIEHPMTLVAEAVTNNNNNSVGTGPVNFEAASGNTQRFKKLTEEDLKAIEINQYSDATKRNTKWGIGVFNAWCIEIIGKKLDLNTIRPDELSGHLRRFYAEAQPKNVSSRVTKMPADQAQEYHKNSLKNVRAAINRYLKDNGKDIDIVKDKEFKNANSMLNAKLKFNLKSGISRPTQHYQLISLDELGKINAYLQKSDPVALRFKIWYLLAIHFVTRGIEFHHQLTTTSLKFEYDKSGMEYITLNHETLQKNHQGGVDAKLEETSDKRMYSTGTNTCPVKSVKNFLQKCDKEAKALFTQCSKESLKSPEFADKWYTCEPVKPKQFSSFMPDICKNAGVQRYTAHSLRATAIQAMSDAGFATRNILFMTDHKHEESLKTYSRRPSTEQKQLISSVLENMANGGQDQSVSDPNTNSSFAADQNQQPLINSPIRISNTLIAQSFQHSNTQLCNQTKHMAGFASNSTFNNCTFNFKLDN
ncbi:hypothetical protein ACJMK2_043349 [Sinanodonta woodiana]|uniref:Tyr recombinase domain-containing protein n=1 Tax=Sinanodonta woodiana TaxID=1069815 RepID=A0ABD3VZR8_SINWO